jgi:hypothetical protein
MIRQALCLPLRQTRGLTALGTAISIPDVSSLSKRGISWPKLLEPGSTIIVDSTRLKIYG